MYAKDAFSFIRKSNYSSLFIKSIMFYQFFCNQFKKVPNTILIELRLNDNESNNVPRKNYDFNTDTSLLLNNKYEVGNP